MSERELSLKWEQLTQDKRREIIRVALGDTHIAGTEIFFSSLFWEDLAPQEDATTLCLNESQFLKASELLEQAA